MSVRSRMLMLCVLAFVIGGFIALLIPVIMFLQPDVLTTVHHAAVAAYDTTEHSRDVLGPYVVFGAVGLAFAIGIAAVIAAEIRE